MIALGVDQGLAHAAADEHADETGEDLDRDDHAEVRRHEQARQDDPEGELQESVADIAERQLLDATVDDLPQVHALARPRV